MKSALSQPHDRRILAVVRCPVGGVRTHIAYTYPLLMPAGYRFTFVIPQSEYHEPFRADVANWPGVEIVEVPSHKSDRDKPKFYAAVRKLLKRGGFSLIHSHGIQAAIPAGFANVGIGLPHILTSQDVFCHVELPGVVGRLKLYALAQFLRRLDAVIAVSEDTRDDHLQYLPGLRKGPCRVVVVPNGIDLDRYALRNGQHSPGLRDQLGIAPNTFLLGFLGRFMPQKGFFDLVEALERLLQRGSLARPVQVLAVGSGDLLVNYRGDLEAFPLAKQRITFLEHVPSSAPILRELDLLVMPSLWEACPILPMEAMCMGTPVLGSDCIGLREVLRDTPSRMVPAADVDKLAAALESAVCRPWTEEARQFAPEARQRFDVAPTALKLQGVFDNLVVRC